MFKELLHKFSFVVVVFSNIMTYINKKESFHFFNLYL